MSRSAALFILVVLLLSTPPAPAQQLIRKHLDAFGESLAGLPDLDGDSVRDYALLDLANGTRVIRVYSGASGTELFNITASQLGSDLLGYVFGGAGDIDGDGVPELLISSENYPYFEGTVSAVSGVDGSVLLSVYGGSDHDELGAAVAGIDDVDGDGTPDFLAGALELRYPRSGKGYVRCFSGRTGAGLYLKSGRLHDDQFGRSITVLSDHDGDGLRDFAATAISEIRVCSGKNGATIASIRPSAKMDSMLGVAEVDDLDGDGEPEIAVGEFDLANLDGQVRVISIPTQAELRLHKGENIGARFGWGIATISDANGDGVRDYLISAPFGGTARNSASLYSGRTGELLYRFADPDADYSMGNSIADLGDIDGDGRADVVIASPLHLEAGVRGAALLYSGNDLWLDSEPKFPLAGDAESLIVHGAPSANPVALFLTDVDGTPMIQLLALGTSDAVESFTLQDTVPAGLAGTTMTFHAYALDASFRVISSANEKVLFQ